MSGRDWQKGGEHGEKEILLQNSPIGLPSGGGDDGSGLILFSFSANNFLFKISLVNWH